MFRPFGSGSEGGPRPPRLTDRQLECLYWAQEGKSSADIGQILGISPRTVDGHFAKICAILGVRTRVQAVVRARELGLLGPRDGPWPPGEPGSFRPNR